MGMAFRVRRAEGWWIFIGWLLFEWKPAAEMWLFERDDKEKAGVTCWLGWICCCKGEAWGEPLDRDPSEEEEWIDCN